ncbi:MAG: gamma-aminobutyrate permease, partial [Legionellaceae bacterium]|nr:gamma-aminobutyrate permease [Legionellaceae bacterium]
MTSLGEMASFMPTSGSFYTYGAHFFDPAFGFAQGINYWFNWAITLAAEIAAAVMIMKFWFPHASTGYWSALFLALLFSLNVISVKGFGEAEFWMSFVKVVVVVLFIVCGISIALGVIGHHHVGLHNWHAAGGSFHGGILAIIGVFMVAGFSFQGTELVGVAAGESKDPGRSIPNAIRKVFWRILLFYILSMAVIATLIPSSSPQLLKNDVLTSPFTLVFTQSGIHAAAGIMNLVILIAVLSAGNSGMYASTRMLWYLSTKGHAPKIFSQVSRRGVPVWALVATTLVGAMAFLSSKFGSGSVYTWLLNASGLSGFITWWGIAISHYRFRRAYIKQGRDLSKLPYRAKAFPFGPIFALILCTAVIIGQDMSLLRGHFDWHGILVSYIGLPIFLLLWFGYKWLKKTKIVPLSACNFTIEESD